MQTSAVLGLRVAVLAFNLLALTRIFGASGYALLTSLVALAIMLGKWSTLGLEMLFLRDASDGHKAGRALCTAALPTILVTGCVLFSAYSLIVFGLMPAAAVRLGWLLPVAVGLSELVVVPALGLGAIARLADGHPAASQLIRVAPALLRLPVVGLLWQQALPGAPAAIYASGYLGSSIIALIVADMPARFRLPRPRTWHLPDRHTLRESVRFSLMNFSSAASGEFDKALAPYFLALPLAGSFAVAARVTSATTLPVVALMISALPRLFRLRLRTAEGNNRLSRRLLWSILIYACAVSAGLWFLAPFVRLVFGNEYTQLTLALRSFCGVLPAMVLWGAMANILISRSQPLCRVAIETSGAALLLPVAWVLVRWAHLMGMIAALGIVQWGMVCTGLFVITRVRADDNYS